MEQYEDASNGVIFPKGQKMPEMFSKYFIGEAYLNMLVLQVEMNLTALLAMQHLNQVVVIVGTNIREVKFFQ